MSPMLVRRSAAALLAAAAWLPAPALAAACGSPVAGKLGLGSATTIRPGAAQSYVLALGPGEGVIVDLVALDLPPAAEAKPDETPGKADRPALRLCDVRGAVVAPQPWDVFENGGAVSAIPDGLRLRFAAATGGSYRVEVDAGSGERELLARRRTLAAGASAIAARLGGDHDGKIAKDSPPIYSFFAGAGQWVELKATSESDTLLRLVGPDRAGAYSQIAVNDDSDGLNPTIRRRLPYSGTYYLRLETLGADSDDYTLSLKAMAAPVPPPPPAALRLGAAMQGKLTGEDDVTLYALPVEAGHAYRLELTAPYDAYLAIGVANPVEAEDGDATPAAGFSEVRAQDAGTEGTERLDFTARAAGTLLVEVKSFGIGESDGGYTLTATDLGS